MEYYNVLTFELTNGDSSLKFSWGLAYSPIRPFCSRLGLGLHLILQYVVIDCYLIKKTACVSIEMHCTERGVT